MKMNLRRLLRVPQYAINMCSPVHRGGILERHETVEVLRHQRVPTLLGAHEPLCLKLAKVCAGAMLRLGLLQPVLRLLGAEVLPLARTFPRRLQKDALHRGLKLGAAGYAHLPAEVRKQA